MEPIWDWGNDVIVSIQAVHNPILDDIFNAITLLGEVEFFLLIFPFIIWSIDKSVGVRLVYLVSISIAVNTWAKSLVNHPRPFEWPSLDSSPVLKLNDTAYGPGLPSGHTQTSLVLWFYLAYKLNRTWLWWVAAILFVLVSFSRVYLGVHFPTDLLGGAILGLIILLLFIRFEPSITTLLKGQSTLFLIGASVLLPLIIMFLHRHADTIAVMSTLSGFSLGVIFDQQKIGFEATGSILQRLGRYLLGLLVLLVIFEGLGILVPSQNSLWHLPIQILRYVAAGFWISGGALWLFWQIDLWQMRNKQIC
jgi:membrane-associated phospholipid phosphatase